MSWAVVDASALATFYLVDDPRQERVASRLSVALALYSPAHLDAEVVSALRGVARRDPSVGVSIQATLRHLADAPIRRKPLAPLLGRMWELRDNLNPYDAAYIALAERVRATLVTCDRKLAGAGVAVGCEIEVIT